MPRREPSSRPGSPRSSGARRTSKPPAYEVSTLPSGLTVISAPMAGATTVAAALFVGVGAAHESPEQSGWSHLLEHLHLSPDASAGEARHRLDAIHARGAFFNASTSLQYTTYTVHVSQRYWRSISRLVAAALSSPVLAPERVAMERKVVLEEAAMRSESPNARFAAAASASTFAGTPYAKPIAEIAGRPDSLALATSGALASWRAERYVASNAWVVVAGAIDHEQARAFAAQIKLPAGPRPPEPVFTWHPAEHAAARLADPSSHQTSVAMDWPTFGDRDRRSVVMGLAASFLAAGTGGRLFTELRTKRGLTYDPAVEHAQYPDAGALEVWFESSSPEAADAAVATTIDCVTNDWQLIDETTLRRLQRQAIGRYELATADPEFLVFLLGDTFASLGHVQQPEFVARRIRGVTVSEVVDLWREYLRPERVVITRQN